MLTVTRLLYIIVSACIDCQQTERAECDNNTPFSACIGGENDKHHTPHHNQVNRSIKKYQSDLIKTIKSLNTQRSLHDNNCLITAHYMPM